VLTTSKDTYRPTDRRPRPRLEHFLRRRAEKIEGKPTVSPQAGFSVSVVRVAKGDNESSRVAEIVLVGVGEFVCVVG